MRAKGSSGLTSQGQAVQGSAVSTAVVCQADMVAIIDPEMGKASVSEREEKD